ncbi:MAG: glycine zipper 2TM domain-containing protein [Betaproteobacteria bacterium]
MNRSIFHALAAVAAAFAFAAPAAVSAQAKCQDCGKVLSIQYVQQKGQGTGLGAIGGAVVGGVIGHQIGSGRGNTAATVAGAAGGAYVGNEVEKNRKSTAWWEVRIAMDGGATRTFTFGSQPTVREGERVKLVDGGRRLALIAN